MVSFNDVPIWGMNYCGMTLNEKYEEEAIDKALKPALMKFLKMIFCHLEFQKNL